MSSSVAIVVPPIGRVFAPERLLPARRRVHFQAPVSLPHRVTQGKNLIRTQPESGKSFIISVLTADKDASLTLPEGGFDDIRDARVRVAAITRLATILAYSIRFDVGDKMAKSGYGSVPE